MIRDTNGAPIRLAYLWHSLSPYILARMRGIVEAAPDVDLHVIETCARESIREWEVDRGGLPFRLTTLHQGSLADVRRPALLQRLRAALRATEPRMVVIDGYYEWPMLAALAWAKRRRLPVGMFCESQAVDFRRRWWREAPKRLILRAIDGVLAAGSRTEDYMLRLGVKGERIFKVGNIVDSEHFRAGAEDARLRRRPEDFDLPHVYFLCCARFAPEKNLEALLRSYAAYREVAGGEAWDLVLVGGGALEPALRSLARTLEIEPHCRIVGFQQYARIPAYYAWAGALVLPSLKEPWGLVVNEAMACGLPVVVSAQCGCAADLVREGVNGFVFDAADERQLTEALGRTAFDPDLSRRMGGSSLEIIGDYSPLRYGQRVADAVRRLCFSSGRGRS
jgi:glycosyltransferase involved in cell wall biosynthesis